MIIHFAVPTHMVKSNTLFYRRIMDVAHEGGHEIARNWIEPVLSSKKVATSEATRSYEDIVGYIIDAIVRSDVVIADASQYGTFGVGYQVAIGVLKGKSVLILHRKGEPSGILMCGLDNGRNVAYREFETDEDAGRIVKTFLESVEL